MIATGHEEQELSCWASADLKKKCLSIPAIIFIVAPVKSTARKSDNQIAMV
jgi:hypothetical protein